MNIKIGILGYGNIGRGVETALRDNPDMELVAVFTRRDPSQVKILSENVPVISVSEIEAWKERLKNTKEKQNYINLPMNKEEYENFYKNLIDAEVVELHHFEKREIFEGCMPIEIMAKRGEDTLRFGPLKPVGFTDPRTGKRP